MSTILLSALILASHVVTTNDSELEHNIQLRDAAKAKKEELNKCLQENKRLLRSKQNLKQSSMVTKNVLASINGSETTFNKITSHNEISHEKVIFADYLQNHSPVKKKNANYEVIKMPDGERVLKISSNKSVNSFFAIVINLNECKGKKLIVSAKVKADNVSKGKKHYYGIKFMLFLKVGDKTCYPGVKGGSGTFDWKPITLSYEIPFSAADKAELIVGLQGVTGSVYYRDIKAVIIDE